MAPPLITAIICTHNRAGYLGNAIDSVLGQGRRDLELVVIDDGSTDGTAQVAAAYGNAISYHYQEQAGPAAARNRAIAAAKSELVAFLDDDDLWSADKLQLQLPAMQDRPEVDIVLGHTQRLLLREPDSAEPFFETYGDPVKLYSLGSALFRRRVFDRLGLLDEKLIHSEDDDWFMRARHHGIGMHFMPEVTQYYRFHGGNMSRDRAARQPYMLRLVKNRLERLRAAGKNTGEPES